jgi:hypothetical protein
MYGDEKMKKAVKLFVVLSLILGVFSSNFLVYASSVNPATGTQGKVIYQANEIPDINQLKNRAQLGITDDKDFKIGGDKNTGALYTSQLLKETVSGNQDVKSYVGLVYYPEQHIGSGQLAQGSVEIYAEFFYTTYDEDNGLGGYFMKYRSISSLTGWYVNSGSTNVNTLNIAINVVAEEVNTATDTISNNDISAGCLENIQNPVSGTPYAMSYYNPTYNTNYTTEFFENGGIGNITALVGINNANSVSNLVEIII